MKSATMAPAFGRDYTSREKVLADWNGGKDFLMITLTNEAYCSKRDAQTLLDAGFTHATFRNSRGSILVNIPITV